jgi:GR25 family glycosyltransferase involved in LPS biosynthesis
MFDIKDNNLGLIGCWLSHYYIWKELSENSNVDMYVIVEDDSIILKNINEAIIKIKDKIKGNTLLYMIHNSHKPMFEQEDGWFGQGTRCYIITKELAKKYVDIIDNSNTKISVAVDWWMIYNYGISNTFVYQPNDVMKTGGDDISTIQ